MNIKVVENIKYETKISNEHQGCGVYQKIQRYPAYLSPVLQGPGLLPVLEGCI